MFKVRINIKSVGFDVNNTYWSSMHDLDRTMIDFKSKNVNNSFVIENSAEPKILPLVNEIFLIDPQTHQVHSVIRQIIPSGDQNVGELAVQQLKSHLESGKYFQDKLENDEDQENNSSKEIQWDEVITFYLSLQLLNLIQAKDYHAQDPKNQSQGKTKKTVFENIIRHESRGRKRPIKDYYE